MYRNIGKKIMVLAKILGWLWLAGGVAGSVVSVILAQDIAALLGTKPGSLLMIGSALACLLAGFLLYVTTWPFYGIGQIIQDVHRMRRQQEDHPAEPAYPTVPPRSAETMPRFAAPTLTRYSETPMDGTGSLRTQDMSQTGNLRPQNMSQTGNLRPQNMSQTGNLRPQNMGQTGNLRPQNMGQTGNLRPQNMGQTGNLRPQMPQQQGAAPRPRTVQQPAQPMSQTDNLRPQDPPMPRNGQNAMSAARPARRAAQKTAEPSETGRMEVTGPMSLQEALRMSGLADTPSETEENN